MSKLVIVSAFAVVCVYVFGCGGRYVCESLATEDIVGIKCRLMGCLEWLRLSESENGWKWLPQCD